MVFEKGNIPWITGKTHSEEARRKMSISGMGNKSRLGKPHSDETKRKISIAHKGKILSDEHKRKISESHKGKRLSEEHRKKISVGNKGRKHSLETRRKISSAMLGKKHALGMIHTDESKRKMRVARLGRVLPTKDTSIEVAIQRELDNRNIVYDKHIPVCDICQPDIVFLDEGVAVFADGDYWHSKDFDNGKRWERDRHQDEVLRENGWSVLRFWGSEIRENVSLCVDKIEGILG